MKPAATLISLPSVELATYDFVPEKPNGQTVLLIHGFASNVQVNWILTRWVDVLLDAGYRVIAADNRGHGESQKFYDSTDYGPDIFANDWLELMDAMQIDEACVIGFSMGARITAWLCHAAPERVRCAVFGGMGIHITGGRGNYDVMAHGLETDDIGSITDPTALAFRKFADRTGSDRMALGACVRPSVQKLTLDMIKSISVPVLVAVGAEDQVGGSPHELAAIMPNAKAVEFEGLDHMKSTGAEVFKNAVLTFLKEQGSEFHE